MHIMIVDDDEDFREALSMVLSTHGHQVEANADALDALTRLRAGSSPSLILLDMMMPRLDGEEFMRIVRKDPHMASIPVVIISGHQAAAQKANELGAAGYLVKPVELAHLVTLVSDIGERSARPIPAGGPP